jgi:Caspase domain
VFNKSSGSYWKKLILPNTAGFLLLLFFLLTTLTSSAQNFYYIEAKPGTATVNKASTYFIFLNMQADGSTTARIRFIKPSTGETCLTEQSFKDSVLNGNRMLVANGKAQLLAGNDDSAFMAPQIYFEQRTDSLGAYYTPSAIDFINADGQLVKTELTVLQEKTYKQLGQDLTLVRSFYSERDAFYLYLIKLGTRGLNTAELNTNFYFIALVNTLDSSIGISAQKDLTRMTETFATLTKQVGIRFVPIIIAGVDFNIANAQRVIDTVKPKAGTDIVFFYYSGHGFRYSDDVSKFPRISFRTTRLQLRAVNNLGVEEVYNKLLAKKARVTIVISDCCNENIGASVPVGMDLLRPRSSGTEGLKVNFDNFKKLFLPPQPLSIIVGSAEKNQLAVGNPSMGGYFTNYFQAQLQNSLYTNTGESSWLRLLIKAKESTTQKALSALCKGTANGRCTQRAELRVLPPL